MAYCPFSIAKLLFFAKLRIGFHFVAFPGSFFLPGDIPVSCNRFGFYALGWAGKTHNSSNIPPVP
jgi:hypothetical protein